MAELRGAQKGALDHVRALLKSDAWMTRCDGLTLAQELGLPDLGKAVAGALADRNWAVRERAASVALNISDGARAEVEPALKNVLGDGVARVRLAAYKALVTWRPDSEYVDQALADAEPEVSYWAAQKYLESVRAGRLGAEARSRLIDSIISRFQARRWSGLDSGGVATLFSLGPGAIDALYEAIVAEEPRVRRVALSAIGSMAGRSSVDLMFQFMDDPDPSVRVTAMNTVVSHCEQSHAARLLEMLGSTADPQARRYIPQAFGRLKYKPAIPRLLEMARGSDQSTRRVVFQALAQIGDKSIAPGLLEMYRAEGQGWLRSDMVAPIAQLLGPEAGVFLMEAARDDDPNVRRNALYATRQLPKADERIDLLVSIIRADDDDDVRQTAIGSLSDLQSEKIVDVLLEVLKQGGPRSRQTAAHVLGRQRSARAAQAIVEACGREEDPAVRTALIQAMGQIQDAQAVPFLRRALNSEEAEFRAAALNALTRFSGGVTDEELVQFIRKEKDENVLRVCFSLIASRRIADERLVPRLGELADSAQPEIRAGAVSCIAGFDSAQAVGVLCKVIKQDTDGSARGMAVRALVGKISSRKIAVAGAGKSLGEAMESPDESSRWEIISALSGLADRQAAGLLLKALKSDTSDGVRQAAAGGIRRIADATMVPQVLEAVQAEQKTETRVILIGVLGQLNDRRALPFFRESLRAAEPAVQAAALQAIGRFRDASLVPFYVERFRESTSVEVRLSTLENVDGTADRRAMGVLLQALKDDDPRVRRAGVDALVDFCDSEVTLALTGALCEGTAPDGCSEEIVRAIAKARMRQSVERLLETAKKTGDVQVLRRVCSALGKSGDRRAIPVAAGLVRKNESPGLTLAAVEALADLNASGEAALCLELARRETGLISDAAAAAAVKLGAGREAAQLAAERFRDGAEFQKRLYAGALGAMGREAEGELLAAGEAHGGAVAAAVCAVLSPESPGAVEWLRRTALSDAGLEPAASAIEALGRRGAEHRVVFERIVNSGRPAGVRAAALVQLGRSFSPAERKEFGAIVCRYLDDPEVELRLAALRCIAASGGPHAPEVAAGVLSAAGRGDAELRRQAVAALGRLAGNKDAETVLLGLLENGAEGVPVEEAARSLGSLRSERAVPKLSEVAQNGTLAARVAAAGALGSIGTPDAVKALETLFDQKEVDQVRAAAAVELGRRGDAGYVPRLVEGLKSAPGLEVRAGCAEALGVLGVLGGDAARSALVEALRDDSGLVRESAVRALGAIGRPEVRAEIARLLDDPDVRVGAAAKEVTEKLGKGK